MKYYQDIRRIALLVIHCSATREDQDFPVEALRRCHVEERGFVDIGYHFYITRDGITHPCRPLDHIGAHARGFNDHSIAICYEGGLDVHGRPADTRTLEQKIALIALLRELHKDYPEAYIRGHRDLSACIHKACPCFDAAEEYAEFQPDATDIDNDEDNDNANNDDRNDANGNGNNGAGNDANDNANNDDRNDANDNANDGAGNDANARNDAKTRKNNPHEVR